MLFVLIFLLAVPAGAQEITAPPAPDSVEDLMPVETESFGKALWYVIRKAIFREQGGLSQAMGVCVSLICTVLIAGVLQQLPGDSKQAVELACVVGVSLLLINGTKSFISLGRETVQDISEYGKMLLPVMTVSLAAQGAVTASAALYTGTAVFDSLLSTLIAKVLTPLVYLFLVLSVVTSATQEPMLKKLQGFSKWLVSWSLKTVLYIFTGYIGITGVVSGSADAAAIKAAKLTISGVVPVVGGILSDASEAVIVGSGVLRSAVGVYGLLAICAIWIGPFLQIGIQYLMLKLTAGICSIFGSKRLTELIGSFSTAMGLLLGMTGACSFMLLISTVCMMKGVGT